MCKKYGSTFLVRSYAWTGKIWFMTDCRLLSFGWIRPFKKAPIYRNKDRGFDMGKDKKIWLSQHILNGVRPMRDGMLLLFGQDLFELRFVLVCGNLKWQPQDQEIWSETMSSLATNCVWVSLSISRGLNLLVKHFRFLVEKLTWYWLKNHDDTWHGMDSSKFGCL